MVLEIILIILAFALVLSGIFSVVFPVIPGIPLAWLGVLIFAFATNFTVVSLKAVLMFSLFTAIAMALEFFAPILGAAKYRASKESILASFVGTIVGVFFFGPLGIVLGGFAGLIFGEIMKGKEPEEVGGVLKGTFIGFLVGGAVKLVLTVAILAYLITAVFKL